MFGCFVSFLLIAIWHNLMGSATDEPNGTNQTLRRNLLSQSDHLDLIRRYIPLIENKTLVVCAIVREPFVIYNSGGPSNMTHEQQAEARANLDNYGGVAIEVVRRLALIFRFNIKIIWPEDNQFGVYQADRRAWSGLMGVLARGEADIGLTALSITMSRAQVIDFTRAYYVETATILLRTPEEVQNYLAIFEPFSLAVWLVLLTTIMLLIMLITIMTKLEDDQYRREKAHKLARLFARRQLEQHEDHPRRMSTHQPSQDQMHEFGSTWLERFYYAVSCVINILLIRGK